MLPPLDGVAAVIDENPEAALERFRDVRTALPPSGDLTSAAVRKDAHEQSHLLGPR
jgi:hypothetical protein